MELKLQNGDYVLDGAGGLVRTDGTEELLARALFRLSARRNAFPFLDGMGSDLYRLGSVPFARRRDAAEQYVTEALSGETAMRVLETELSDGGVLTVRLELDGQSAELRFAVR